MTIRPLITALLLLAAHAPAQSTKPSTQSLIDSLCGPDWQARQQAEDALVASGENALATIETSLAGDAIDFETRERLLSARNRIEQGRLLSATRVTVQRQFDSPVAAFRYLAEEVDLSLDPNLPDVAVPERRDPNAKAEPVALDLVDVPWLAALDELTARTRIATELAGTQLRLLPTPPEALRPPTDYTGSAAIIATGARRRDTIQLGDDTRRGDVYISLGVELEPKFDLVPATARLLIRTITDPAGTPFRSDQVLSLTRRSGNRYVANLTLGTAGNLPASIGRVEGELQGEIVTRTEELRITELATLPRNVDLTDGTIELTSIQSDDKGHVLVLSVPQMMMNMPSGQAFARGQIDGLQILDQDKRPMLLTRSGTQHRAGLVEYRFTLTPPDPANPSTPTAILWNVPTQSRDIRLPFKLENLPLPE